MQEVFLKVLAYSGAIILPIGILVLIIFGIYKSLFKTTILSILEIKKEFVKFVVDEVVEKVIIRIIKECWSEVFCLFCLYISYLTIITEHASIGECGLICLFTFLTFLIKQGQTSIVEMIISKISDKISYKISDKINNIKENENKTN